MTDGAIYLEAYGWRHWWAGV